MPLFEDILVVFKYYLEIYPDMWLLNLFRMNQGNHIKMVSGVLHIHLVFLKLVLGDKNRQNDMLDFTHNKGLLIYDF